MGNPLAIVFGSSMLSLILCLSVHVNYQHDQCWNTITTTFYLIFMVSTCYYYYRYCYYYVFLKSKKYYHGTASDQLSAEYQKVLVGVDLAERCVRSWSRYRLKQVIPWKLYFGSSLFLFLSGFSTSLIYLWINVHENHKHVQG